MLADLEAEKGWKKRQVIRDLLTPADGIAKNHRGHRVLLMYTGMKKWRA